ncbi:MAG: hypothetical protein K2G40_02195 [Muribaculaceae bacterium]|nr:hypothetical protein [Muribaculaceae bacterium]
MKKNGNTHHYTRDELLGLPPKPWTVIVVTVGLLAIVVATMVPLLGDGFNNGWYRYLYAAGAVMSLAGRLFAPYTGTHQRMKRLHRLEAWSSIFFCVAAFFMFYDPIHNRDWLAFTLAGGAVQILSTFLSTRLARKELNR